jgi:hypothetical protein
MKITIKNLSSHIGCNKTHIMSYYLYEESLYGISLQNEGMYCLQPKLCFFLVSLVYFGLSVTFIMQLCYSFIIWRNIAMKITIKNLSPHIGCNKTHIMSYYLYEESRYFNEGHLFNDCHSC